MDAPYLTHVPLLAAAVANSHGPVLELGAGYGSTLMLHGLCGSAGRSLTTLESDPTWAARFAHLCRPWHVLRVTPQFEQVDEYEQQWGLVFVDHGIAQQRGTSIARLRETPLIIVHDTCHPELYGYEPLLSTFRYRWDYAAVGPMTTAVSNVIDVRGLFAGLNL
jgi:hypothetical protein